MEYKWKHTNKLYNNVLLYENRHATWYGLPVSNTDFGGFLCDADVLHFDTDFAYINGDIIFSHIMSLYSSKITAKRDNRLLLVIGYIDSKPSN